MLETFCKVQNSKKRGKKTKKKNTRENEVMGKREKKE